MLETSSLFDSASQIQKQPASTSSQPNPESVMRPMTTCDTTIDDENIFGSQIGSTKTLHKKISKTSYFTSNGRKIKKRSTVLTYLSGEVE
jgi:hypothetical protein